MQNVVVISIIITIIIIIIILVITIMQDIYNYIPETNHVSRVYTVAAVLYLQFVLYSVAAVLYLQFVLYSVAAVLYLQFVLYTVAAVLYLQFVLHVTLFPMSNFHTFILVLPSVSVQCPIWLFFVSP